MIWRENQQGEGWVLANTAMWRVFPFYRMPWERPWDQSHLPVQARRAMAKDKFCFVQTSPFGQSKEAQKLEQLRARAHAASVSPRRKRTSFQIIHDVLYVPAPQLDLSATAYGLP